MKAVGVMGTMIFMGFSLMMFVYSMSGAKARRNPLIFLILGIFVTSCGVLIGDMVNIFSDLLGWGCKQAVNSKDCADLPHITEFTKKVIEIGFAAVGAGLIYLSMDLRSEQMLRMAINDLEREEIRLKERSEQWRKESDSLANSGLSDEDKERYSKRLKNRQINLLDLEEELISRRRRFEE